MLNSSQKKLIEDNIDYAKKIAKKRWEGVKHRYTLDEIESCAFMGLVKAANNFDFSKDVKFKTYSTKYINGLISREVSDDKRYNVKRAVAHDKPILSLNEQYKSEEGKSLEYIDLVTDERESFEDLLNNYEVNKLLDVLDHEEREIIDMYFYNNLTQEEIAEMLNVHQSTVSRGIKKSIEKIRSCLTTSK